MAVTQLRHCRHSVIGHVHTLQTWIDAKCRIVEELGELFIQLHTELPGSDSDGKLLTVDFDIEVSFIFLRIITAHVIDVVMPFCSAPQ